MIPNRLESPTSFYRRFHVAIVATDLAELAAVIADQQQKLIQSRCKSGLAEELERRCLMTNVLPLHQHKRLAQGYWDVNMCISEIFGPEVFCSTIDWRCSRTKRSRARHQPEHLVFFFERALRTVTRLYLGKLHYVRMIRRTRQALHPLLELHIEASSSNRRTGNYNVDLSQLLSLAPNLVHLTISGVARNTARHIMPTICRLRQLSSVRMIDCSYDRTFDLTQLDMGGLGALPQIKHIFISGIAVYGYDDFLSNLAESGGARTLETIQVALAGFIYIDQALQRLHDVCPGLQFAHLDLR